jgi:hypothetical protein
MDAIESSTIVHDGRTYRITVYADENASNPLEDWPEMGTILSLNRGHANFAPESVAEAMESNPDAVALSYFEHGRCLWCVAGELPASARCPWDSVGLAGVWLPDADTLGSARRYGGSTRRHFMRKRARLACEAYTRWCNGEIYGYEIERVLVCDACGDKGSEVVESGWGYYGWDECVTDARAAVAARRESRPLDAESPPHGAGAEPGIDSG